MFHGVGIGCLPLVRVHFVKPEKPAAVIIKRCSAPRIRAFGKHRTPLKLQQQLPDPCKSPTQAFEWSSEANAEPPVPSLLQCRTCTADRSSRLGRSTECGGTGIFCSEIPQEQIVSTCTRYTVGSVACNRSSSRLENLERQKVAAS